MAKESKTTTQHGRDQQGVKGKTPNISTNHKPSVKGAGVSKSGGGPGGNLSPMKLKGAGKGSK